MDKQNIFLVIIGIVIICGIGSYFLVPDDEKDANVAQYPITFYYGDTCPHCQKVEAYIAENDIEQHVDFVQKEVYNDTENANELRTVAEFCGMDTTRIGVPVLWTGEECLLGDQDIIAFFGEYVAQ